MSRWEQNDHTSIVPIRSPRLLGTNLWIATDAKLWHGDVRPFPCPEPFCSPVTAGTKIKTYYPLENCDCLAWSTKVDIVKDSICDLYFWTGQGSPKMGTAQMLCNDTPCDYSIPCPNVAPTVNVGGSSDCDFAPVAYRYTYVIELGGREMESHWSPPSVPVSAGLTPNASLSAPAATHPCVTKIRWYRAVTTAPNGQVETNISAGWVTVGESLNGAGLVDNLSATQLRKRDPIGPEDYYGPPPDLTSLIKTDDGILAGISNGGYTIRYTLPNYPMSWTSAREIKLRTEWGKALRIVDYGEDIAVITDNKPIWLSRVLTETGIKLQPRVHQKSLPLISEDSVVKGYAGIGWASYSGFFMMIPPGGNQGARVINVTSFWGRDDWKQLNPESITAHIYERWLLISTSVDAFMMDVGDNIFQPNENGQIVGLDMGGLWIGADMIQTSSEDGTVIFSKDNQMYKWDLSADVQIRNRKEFDKPKWCEDCCPYTIRYSVKDMRMPTNLNTAEILLDERHVTDNKFIDFKFYNADCGVSELVTREEVKNCEPFRIGDCNSQQLTYLELSGCIPYSSVILATSIKELLPNV